MNTSTPFRFEPGMLVTTPGAAELMEAQHVSPLDLLARHLSGDWSELPAEDARANDDAIRSGCRILSSYTLGGERIWLITEADRSSTTFLLPSEY